MQSSGGEQNQAGKWIQHEKIPGAKSVMVRVDLGPYVNAFRDKVIAKELRDAYDPKSSTYRALDEDYKLALEEYEKIKDALISEVASDTFRYWPDILDLAVDKERLKAMDDGYPSDEDYDLMDEAAAIESSAASEYMQDFYIEILKNAMDEAVLKTIRLNQPTNQAVLRLRVDIDDKSKPSEVSIRCTDNGRGFPPEFRETNLANREKRRNYVDNRDKSKFSGNISGSQSGSKRQEDMPSLFGGQNRGLRMAIATIDDGDVLETNKRVKRYAPLEMSEINFTNQPGAGACITVTTSKEPLAFYEEEQNDFMLDDVFASPAKDRPESASSEGSTDVESRSSSHKGTTSPVDSEDGKATVETDISLDDFSDEEEEEDEVDSFKQNRR
jgi:hypothetical protein